MHGNTKLALMPLLPTLCVCEKVVSLRAQCERNLRQICIKGYSTKYYFKLTLKIIKENSNFFGPCHLLQKLESDYLILISKF